MVIAQTNIIQFGPPDGAGSYEWQKLFLINGLALEQQKSYVLTITYTISGIYPAQNPMPRGHGPLTTDRRSFSDSPDNNPDLFDQQRYAYGRPTGTADNYGTLQNDHGQIMIQKEFEAGDSASVNQFHSFSGGHIWQRNYQLSMPHTEVQNILVSAYTSIEQFEFLLEARPVPYSIKNPVDSDVYIRLSNHSVYPLDPDTVTLRLDGVLKADLEVVPFFGGIGGLDITWHNDLQFEYGHRVDVVWEVYNTDSPPEKVKIEYWFSTVEDLIGPRISNRVPSDASTGISILSYIIFDVTDLETGVDISTLEVYINNLEVTSGFTIVEIPNGYRVQCISEAPFLYGDTIPVVVKIRDKSEKRNLSFFVWSFSTEGSLAPVLINMDPSPCQTNVERIRNISFEIVDAGHGLDEDSVVMGIDNLVRSNLFIVPIIHRFD